VNSDFYFAMGKSHMICQDYAYSGINSRGNHVAIVSDGCSSSPESDFGSRYIVRSAVICGSALDIEDPNYFREMIARNVVGYASQFVMGLHLSQFCLDATLLYLEVQDDNIIVVTAGDGVVFAENLMGALEVWNIEYPSGSPYFPSYLLNDERREIYEQECGTQRVKTFSLIDNDNAKDISSQVDNVSCDCFVLNKKNYRFIGVASDGILTFDNMSNENALRELTSFKNYTGEFVKRRMRKFLKQCHKENTFPTDDISMAVINLED